MEFPDAFTLSSSVLQQYCDHIHILPSEAEVDNIRPTFNKTSQELAELGLIQKCTIKEGCLLFNSLETNSQLQVKCIIFRVGPKGFY